MLLGDAGNDEISIDVSDLLLGDTVLSSGDVVFIPREIRRANDFRADLKFFQDIVAMLDAYSRRFFYRPEFL